MTSLAADSPEMQLPRWGQVLLVAALWLLFLSLGFLSNGAYNLDEVYHASHFPVIWRRPENLLNYFARPGFKLLYLLPSLLGTPGLVATSSLFSALTCLMAARIAARLRIPAPWLAAILCAAVPIFWLIGFRTFSEVPATFLLAVAVERAIARRWMAAALVISGCFLIRQEMAVLAVAFGVLLLLRKEWKAFLALAWAPLLLGLLGALWSGRPLWLLSDYLFPFTAEGNDGAYGSLFLSLGYILGPAMLMLAVVGAAAGRRHFLMDTVGYGFTLAVLLLYYAIHMGMSKGLLGNPSPGHWRMLAPLTPYVAVFAAAGAMLLLRTSWWRSPLVLTSLAATLVLIAACFSFKTDGYFIWTDGWKERPVLLAGGVLAAVLLLRLLGRQRLHLAGTLLGLALVVATAWTGKTWKMRTEEKTMQQAAMWFRSQHPQFERLLCNNVFFYLHSGIVYDLQDARTPGITAATLRAAPPGTWVVWDTHFGHYPSKHWGVQEDSLAAYDLEPVTSFSNLDVYGQPFRALVLRKR